MWSLVVISFVSSYVMCSAKVLENKGTKGGAYNDWPSFGSIEEISRDEFEEHVADAGAFLTTLMVNSDKMNKEIQSLTSSLSETQSTISTLSNRVQTLEADFKDRTVKRCLSGNIGKVNEDFKTVNFSPAFDKAPSVTYGLQFFDADKKDVRIHVHLQDVTANSAKFFISTWGGSNIAAGTLRWMACA